MVGVVLAQTDTSTNSGTTTSPETTCTTGNGKWCKNSDGVTGWCSYSTSPCPAYDAASCTAQSGEWCTYSGGATGGWCSTGGYGCPINDEATCVAKSRKWCTSSYGGSGWCANTGENCPANDEASCKAQNGEWCASTSGGTGWCATNNTTCPIYDQATCTAKGRSWCTSSYGGGWCQTAGSSCPDNSYTCSDGTKVTDSSKCPATTMTCSDGVTKVTDWSKCPTNYETMTWPSNESDCTKFQGVWCKSNYSGSMSSGGYCNPKGSTCAPAAPSGKVTCWDNSFADSWGACPMTPSNSTDCKAKGATWCEFTGTYSSTAMSGWCMSAGSVCMKAAPTGQMICPDNFTAVTKLSACPTASLQIIPVITYKTCPDGSSVESTAVCPKPVTYIICSDGSKVTEGTACPVKTEDPIAVCAAKGGTWCLDKTEGSTGYCSSSGVCKTVVEVKELLTEHQIKTIEQKKKSLNRTLDSLWGTFKKLSDSASMDKITGLREKIQNTPLDMTAFDTLEAISDDVQILRDLKNELISNNDTDMSERDREMQEKALKQLKRKMAEVSRQFISLKNRATLLEKRGYSLPQSLKELLDSGQKLVEQIKEAKTFEEARDAGEALADIFDGLNEWLVRLEQLSRLLKVAPMITQNIARREKEYKRVVVLMEKLNVDAEAQLKVIGDKIAEARTAYDKLKTNDYLEQEPFDFVQEQIIDKLQEADASMSGLRGMTSLKASVNKLAAAIKRYEARINRLAKSKKDVSELKALLEDLKDRTENLREAAKVRLDEMNASDVMDNWDAAANLQEQIEDSLKISVPSDLEKQLRSGLNKANLKKFDVPAVEEQVLRAYRVASFFRRPASQLALFQSVITTSKAKSSVWRSYLVKDW